MSEKTIGDIDLNNEDNKKILKQRYGYHKAGSTQDLIDSVEVEEIIYS